MGRIEPVLPDDAIIEFAESAHYLGGRPDVPPLSVPQRAGLKALYGVAMTREERLAYLKLSEGREPRKGGYREAALIVGRGGGKSVLGSIVLTFECTRWGPVIAQMMRPGQVARGVIIAQNIARAGELRGYVEGNIHALENPACKCGPHWPDGILAKTEGQERAITGAGIKLRWPVEINIMPSNKAAVRGATVLCAICDEIAYWEAAEGAYNQDTKILVALRPAMVRLPACRPRLLMISSKDEEQGALYNEWKNRETNKSMVLMATSWDFNPSIPQDDLDRAQEKDPENFAVEYGNAWRRTGGENSFLAAEIVDQCIDRGRTINPYKPGTEYIGWIDPGFKHDPFAVGIGHLERSEPSSAVVDLVHRWLPPKGHGRHLSPAAVIPELVDILRAYGCDVVRGDQYADVPIQEMLDKHGIKYIVVPATNVEKNEAYKNTRGALRARRVSLPDDPVLLLELKSLIRKETAGGQVHISAPKRKNLHDDLATVVSRIVAKLLPMGGGLDIERLNAGAIRPSNDPARAMGLDWDARVKEMDDHGFGAGDIMGARF